MRVVLQAIREARELMEAGDGRGARRVLLGGGLAMARLVSVPSSSLGAICIASHLLLSSHPLFLCGHHLDASCQGGSM
jgi:hypothetical protein